jgi:phosphoglycolate phosphatase/pyrophosphatase PpaX
MNLKGVMFDFDGTLADTLPVCVEAFRRAAEPLTGRTYTDAEIVATFGPSEEGNVKVLAPDAPEQCLRDYLVHYEQLHGPEPFEGIHDLLKDLKGAGLKIALVTAKGPRTAEISLRLLNMAHYFDLIETGWEHGIRKKESIEHVLEQWQVSKDEVVYVGDAPSDVRISREVGVPVVGVVFGGLSQPEQLAAMQPDALFHRVEDLREWLLARA